MPDEQTDPDQGEPPTASCSVQDREAIGSDDTTRTDDQSITGSKRHSPSEHQQPAPSHSRGIFTPSRIALVVILSALLGVVGYFAYNLTVLFNPGLEPGAHSKKGAQQEQPPSTCATIHTSPPCRFSRKNRITRAMLPL